MQNNNQALIDILKKDLLIQCFSSIAEIKEKPVELQDLIPHLPASNKKITPYILLNAIEKLGFKGRLYAKSFDKIPTYSPPVILILKDEKYCLLLEKDNKSQTAVVQFLDGKEKQEISYDALSEKYAGYYLVIKSRYDFGSWLDNRYTKKFKESWFWSVIFEYKSFYAHVLLAALFVNIFALAMPLFIMNVYDRVVPNNALVTLWTLAIGVIIVFIFDFLLKTLRSVFIDVANKKIDMLLSTRLLGKALSITMEHQSGSSGVRASHLREFDTIRDFFSSVTTAGLIDIPFTIIFIVVIGLIGGPLFFVPIIMGAIIVVAAVLLSKPIYRYVTQTFAGSAQKTAILFESLSAIEAVKSTSAYQQILGTWRSLTVKVGSASLKSKFFTTIATNITAFCSVMGSVVTVIWGVYLIQAGELTTGGLIACVILTGRALAPLGQVTALLTRYQQTKCSYDMLNKLMSTPEDRPTGKTYLNHDQLNGGIAFNNVSFQYPMSEVDFMKDVSFEIQPGEKVAILGNNGSGKTTLIKLMLGFYKPTQGEIFFDKMHQEQLDPELIRKEIGYLEQFPRLMFGNAASNILMRAPWLSANEVLNAAKISGADEFLRRHHQGYQMTIGENGQGLSGGEIKMIALARAILTNPPMIVLDEPTSSIDSSSQRKLIQNLKSYIKDKTFIVCTHNKEVLSIVDRIIVMHQGRVIMDGPRGEILEKLDNKREDRD